MLTRFLHAALLVSDLDKAEQFYGTVLGLTKIDRPLKYPGAWYQLGEVQIHLMADPRTQVSLTEAEKWGWNPHLAIATPDLDAMKTRLVEHGYPVQMSASGRPALFTRDPDGNVLEIGQV
ncbi:glyoxalase [Thermoleptolyngbya sichuanensis A183]|uniref:Glyoxalase n=1 Tax=Thermoleptolyngbya sichuanensis A183 TaxID=2737172 RepID=A0A6M8B4Y9_9CYAN|nr:MULTISPECIES: VOC family protein [Thermoleptolyngbya]QKD82014.1 glyoxalase [Thermoleptolyngbya sichuanensis A183]